MSDMSRFPIYIPSKGRADSRLTVKALERMNIDYRIIVEENDYDNYRKHIDKKHILVLEKSFQENYDTCDSYGLERPPGSGPARNFAWEHSIDRGYTHHWIIDDNIRGFYYFTDEKKYYVLSYKFFWWMEEFILRYKNVVMGGPHYNMFVQRKVKTYPFNINTRIFSCNLIRNDLPFRWRGRYNEDVILSLDILSSGLCTILFNAFLQEKVATQRMKGGNTDTLYKEGTFEKSKMICEVYPQYAKMKTCWGRCHHYIDYKVFKQPLIKDESYVSDAKNPKYSLNLKKYDKKNGQVIE